MDSKYQESQKALIEINVLRQEKESPRYQNEDMIIDLAMGYFEINWHPKSINRIMRFFRFIKLPSQVAQQEKEKLHQKHSQNQDFTYQNYGFSSSHHHHFSHYKESQHPIQLQNCETIPVKLMRVNAKLDQLKIVMIHPINETYPIATLILGKFIIDYEMHYDHDFYQGSMGDFRMYDNTNFPLTVDPRKHYTQKDYPQHEILGLRTEFNKDEVLKFKIMMFHDPPTEKRCPHQDEMFDKQIDLSLNGIKINYQQEPMFRINDYFFAQLLGALSDSNPYQELIDLVAAQTIITSNSPASKRDSVITFRDSSQMLRENNDVLKIDLKQTQPMKPQRMFSFAIRDEESSKQERSPHFDKWKHFDLQQSTYSTGLNITIERPLIVLKDRPYLQNNIEMDLGTTKIVSTTGPVKGKWKSNPEKETWVTKFNIDMTQMSIKYDSNQFQIAPSLNLNIIFEKLNYSPLLEESYTSKDIDFLELDISYKIQMKFSPLIMHLRSDVYTYMLRCIDLNINYTDSLAKYFQLAIWNDGSDTQKYILQEQKTVKMFENKEVYKMKVYMSYPSLALQLHNMDNSFISEFILWNAHIDFLRYVDYRKTIIVLSHSMYILHNEQAYNFGEKMKQVAIAPVSSKNFICTNEDFYNFKFDSSLSKLSPNKKQKAMTKMEKNNFQVHMHLQADGEKLIQTKIEKLKIFIKPHIFLTMYEIFVYGMPTYQDDSKDKPNFYDADYGNAPRMEICCQILSSLLCFENEEKYQKTIACQGNTSFTYIREKVNQIKMRLVEKPQFIDGLLNQESLQQTSRKSSFSQASQAVPTIDTSSTAKIMQISISDLCPFFCSGIDLDGKNFKQVRKREMMSPFTLFYNRSDIIELTKWNDRLFASSPDRLLFKNYQKIEANLERTLLKVSFNDVKILKGIMDHLGVMLNKEYLRLIEEARGNGMDTPVSMMLLDEEKEYLSTYTNSGFYEESKQNLKISSKKVQLAQIEEMSERSPNKDEGSEIQNSFISDESDDVEEEDERIKRLAKIQKHKDALLQKMNTKKGANINKPENFTDSVKRASHVFSMLQRRYTIRQNEFQQMQESNSDQHDSPLQRKRPLKRTQDIIIEEEEEGDDMDEGQLDIQSRVAGRSTSPGASKLLMSYQESEEEIGTQSLAMILSSIKEERGVDQFQVVSYGLKILVINDNLQNFFPVLGISISEFHYSSDQNETQKAGMTQFSSAINYYNAEAGEWEPFIETFKIQFSLMEELVNQKKMLQCELPSNLNINITEKLIKNLSDTYKSWSLDEENQSDESPQQAKSEKQMDQHFLLSADKGGTTRTKPLRQLSKYAFDEIDEEEEFDVTQKEEDVVTPYSINNQTNVKLLVKRLNNLNERDSNVKKSRKHSYKHFQSAVISNKSNSQSKLNRVYVINPSEEIDYAVDYEHQVKQQMNIYNSHKFSGQQGEFIKILFEDVGPMNGGISSGSGMNIPLSSVNLNQVGCKKHYVKDDEKSNHSEFFVYGVTQVNMKKVLTIRTQYLFVNQTFFNYEVHIRFSNSSIIKSLASGDRMPIPDSINSCTFQIRISSEQSHFDAQQDDEDEQSPSMRRKSVPAKRQDIDDSVVLQDVLNQRGDVKNFQIISKNWSDLVSINALKQKLPVNKTTFLKHGKTFTIIQKTEAQFPDAFDITFRPPLLLKNCLPLPILITYDDSNGESDSFHLLKEEEKHVFVFNLQLAVMLKVKVQGFIEQLIVLECSSQREIEIKVTLNDKIGRTLDLYVATSSKSSGKRAIFYVKNCVINNTDQELTFYYSQPNERQVKSKSYKEMVGGKIDEDDQENDFEFNKKKFFMLSNRKQIFASIEGGMEVSNPINIFNPGCNDKFMLSKDNRLYEYAYSTEIFLATKDEYIYSKITTITPLYVLVNHTKQLLVAVQTGQRDIQFVVQSKDRVPFHWANKTKEKCVCLKVMSNSLTPMNKASDNIDYDWSCGFDISELGSLSLQNREIKANKSTSKEFKKFKSAKQRIKYLKVDRRLHNNTIFIIVEEEDIKQPTYKIENFSKVFALRYHQVDEQEYADLLNVKESTPYAWTNYQGVHELEIDLFHGDLNTDNSYYIQGEKLKFSLDRLNYKQQFKIPSGFQEEIPLYVCTFTNGYTKVIRFSDVDNNHITAINQEDKGEQEDENSISLSRYQFNLKQMNLSIIGENKELLVFSLQNIQAILCETEKDTKTEFEIGYMQIDNQSENDPIYPVLMKPKYIKPNFSNEEDDQPSTPRHHYQVGVFQLSLDYRKNIPHVAYFESIDYLLQTLELKIEFSHILHISKFVSKVGSMLNKNLTWMHQIFEQDAHDDPEIEPDFFKFKDSQKQSTLYSLDSEVSPQLRLQKFKSTQNQFKSHDFSPEQFQEEDKQDDDSTSIRLNLAIPNPKMLKRGVSSDQDIAFTRQMKKRTVASSLGLNKRQSTKDVGSSSTGGDGTFQSSMRKNKTLNQDIYRKLKTEDARMMNQTTKVQRQTWKSEQFLEKSSRIYIKEYRAGPVELEISVMNTGSFESDDSDIFKTISSLGLVINSIDEAPIKLNALVLGNVFGNYDDVITQLRKHHSERLKWNLLKFIGASNLLGNPSNFVNALGTGVQDFFYQPKQGFVKGPLQGGLGIIKGTGSLVKNTFIGTIGSASKMVSSVSKGLLVISNDKEFIQQRDVDNIKKKPKNIAEGLKFGLKSALYSMGSGITGVVTQPIEESKKGGFLGFFKGTAKGVAGLVVKPISGTLDFLSLTTEGIKNTTKRDEELALDKRLRLPRPFYENERIIREYDENHAFWINLVPKLKKDIDIWNFYESEIIFSDDSQWQILFLTQNCIMLIVAEQKNPTTQKVNVRPYIYIKWMYETQLIEYAEVVEDQYLTIGFPDKNLNIPLSDRFVAERIRSKIEKIIKILK